MGGTEKEGEREREGGEASSGVSSSYKDTSSVGLGPHPYDLIELRLLP